MQKYILFALLSFSVHAAIVPPCNDNLEPESLAAVETEAKFLIPQLDRLPHQILTALESGQNHDAIHSRGFVLQEYVPVTNENLELALGLTAEGRVPFGTKAERDAMRLPGAAREIRLLTRSLKINGQIELRHQLTVKAAGGVAVNQLETPLRSTTTEEDQLLNIFSRLRPLVTGEVRKLHFTLHHLLRLVEVDVFLNSSRSPFFINGEVEFHDATPKKASDAANFYRNNTVLQPAYVGSDITDTASELGLKSRDLIAGAVPATIEALFKEHREANRAIVQKIGREFATWAEPDLVRRVWDRPAVSARMFNPVVFEPENVGGIKAYFAEHGFVVIDHVSTQADRERVIRRMDQIALNPAARRAGFMDYYHDDELAQLRQNPALYRVFVDLFAEEKLWVVFDRLMYWHPREGDLPLAPHVDQNPRTHPDFFAAQGMLALKDMDESTGTLALAPRSQKIFARYARWARAREGYVEYRGSEDLEFQGIRLRAGQIVIWDSRTTHSRVRGKASGTRYAALLTFMPAVDDETLRDKRRRAYARGTGESDHSAGLRATAHPRYEESLRQKQELLSPLGRKLYGLDSWFTRF